MWIGHERVRRSMADDLGAQEHLLERLYSSYVCSKVLRGEYLQGLLGVEDVIFPRFQGGESSMKWELMIPVSQGLTE